MDAYDILGIPKSATQEEIKKAYRREAMKWHPDRCNNSAEAQERFHRAAEAYKFLSENYSDSEDDAAGKQYSGEHRHKSSASDNPIITPIPATRGISQRINSPIRFSGK